MKGGGGSALELAGHRLATIAELAADFVAVANPFRELLEAVIVLAGTAQAAAGAVVESGAGADATAGPVARTT